MARRGGALRLSLLIATCQAIAGFQAACSLRPGLWSAALQHSGAAQRSVAARSVPRLARGGRREGLAGGMVTMASSPAATGAMTIQYKTINIKTGPGTPPREDAGILSGVTCKVPGCERVPVICAGITVWEITSHIREMLEESGVKNGFVNVISRHTTTGPPPSCEEPCPRV